MFCAPKGGVHCNTKSSDVFKYNYQETLNSVYINSSYQSMQGYLSFFYYNFTSF